MPNHGADDCPQAGEAAQNEDQKDHIASESGRCAPNLFISRPPPRPPLRARNRAWISDSPANPHAQPSAARHPLARKKISRALHSKPSPVEDVRVDHRRADIPMPEELLHRADVVAGFQQVGRERVPKGVAARPLGDPRPADGAGDGALHGTGVQVMTPELLACGIPVAPGRGKDPLPGQLRRRVGELSLQRVRERDTPAPRGQGGLMQRLDLLEVGRERAADRFGQHRHPVLRALPASNENLSPPEIDVLDPQGDRLVEPEAGAVQQGAEETVDPRQLLEHHLHLGAAEHDGQAGARPRPDNRAEVAERPTEHLPIEEEQRAQRLALGGGRHSALGGEAGEERRDVDLAQFAGVAEPVKPDVAPGPGYICRLGSGTVVRGTKRLAEAHHELGRGDGVWGGCEHKTDIAENGRRGEGEKTRPYLPNPAGARARPTAPASAASASRYGITRNSWYGTASPIAWKANWSAGAPPNSSAASSTPSGRQRPSTTIAIAMNPRPAVIFSANVPTCASTSTAPASPASAPPARVARSCTRPTGTPDARSEERRVGEECRSRWAP